MFGSNAHYGHRSILTRYAGVPSDSAIPGLVEHGWNHDLGATLHDIRLPYPDPFFVWSDRHLRQCRRAGQDHVASFGAPFLYLPELLGSPRATPGSLLAVPLHSWERERIPHDFRAYARALGELRREFDPITVCLYWFDYQDEANRRPFEEIDVAVTTVGPRDGNPAFLHDLRSLMMKFEYVTSNRAQTALFYALYLGRKVFFHGPPTGSDERFDHSGELFDAWQCREFPRLLKDRFGDESHRDIGEFELGLPHRRDPEALRELLLCTPARRALLESTVRAYRKRSRRRGPIGRWLDRVGDRIGGWLPRVGAVAGSGV